MKEINLGHILTVLRRKRGITQEELQIGPAEPLLAMAFQMTGQHQEARKILHISKKHVSVF